MRLEPCPSCHRHVRTDEITCPFCAASIESAMGTAAPRPLPDRRLHRAALMSFGLTVAAAGGAASLQACGDDDSDDLDRNAVAIYGAPAQPDAGKVPTKDAGAAKPNPGDNVQPPYGAPPPRPERQDAGRALDAGKSDAGVSDASQSDAGDAGPTDAAVRDAESDLSFPVYGAPAQPK